MSLKKSNGEQKQSAEEQKQAPNVRPAMQSAAAANAGYDLSSSDAEDFDSSDAVSLRFTSDSDDEEYLVPEIEDNQEECT